MKIKKMKIYKNPIHDKIFNKIDFILIYQLNGHKCNIYKNNLKKAILMSQLKMNMIIILKITIIHVYSKIFHPKRLFSKIKIKNKQLLSNNIKI